MQAVAYARIRKVGNSDYQRTERQREVLLKLLDKVKAMSFEDLDRLATRLLPLLTHNVPESEFWGLLAKAPTLMKYKIMMVCIMATTGISFRTGSLPYEN